MNWNLRNRILVPTLALILTITGVLSIVSYWMGSSALETTMNDQLRRICTTGLGQVEGWIEAQRQNVEQWAFQLVAQTALGSTEARAGALAVVNKQMSHAKELYGFYEVLILADTNGLTVACSDPRSIGSLNISDRQYFKDALSGKSAVSQVLQSRFSGNPIVTIASPVLDNGTVRGVMVGVLQLDWFSSRFIANIKVLDTGYAFMFDQTGTFIAHPDKNKILTTKLADFQWGNSVQQSQQGIIHYSYEGDEKIAVYEKSKSLGWGLVTTVSETELNAPITRMARVSLVLGVSALTAGFGIMFMTARSITKPIQHASSNLAAGAEQTTAAATQVSSASQSLAEGASEQAASIEETSASIEAINSMTKRNADHAQQAKTLAQETLRAAEQGRQQVDEMVAAMNAIKTSADNIAKIVKSIDEIAFQTNILALNAAVEAARAGEAGLGFAVVAEEVRALAQRAALAARETAERIDDSITNSTAGVEVSAKAAERLIQITTKARRVDELIAEIATASQEQTNGLGQINAAVSQMDKVTQANAGNAEETAAAAEELNAQALTAREIVVELLRLVEGQTAAPARTGSAGNPVLPVNAIKERRLSKHAHRASRVVQRSQTDRAPTLQGVPLACDRSDQHFRD